MEPPKHGGKTTREAVGGHLIVYEASQHGGKTTREAVGGHLTVYGAPKAWWENSMGGRWRTP